jgi:hypothetical protein
MNRPRGKLVSYGVFEIENRRSEEDHRVQRYRVHARITIFGNTSQIPLRKGVSFGIKYAMKGLPQRADVSITKVVRHPRLTTPEGNKLTAQRWLVPTRTNDDGKLSGYQGYELAYDWELVPGEWTIQLWYEGKKVVAQRFTLQEQT